MNNPQPTILLVDDNEDILEFLEIELQDKYRILKAHHGAAALELLKDEAIQLIVSDVMMPVMDGFELCKILKSGLEYCHIPCILLTAKNTLQSKIEGIEMGADAYIEKPFSPEYLQVQISSLLTNRNRMKEFFAKTPLTHVKSMAYSKADELFLEKINQHILDHIEDPDLDVEKLAVMVNMSKATLYRKIKSLSDMGPNELINVTRLKKAASLMSEGNYKIYEIADQVGFKTQAHFGKNFLKQFGQTPSDFIHQLQQKEK